MPDDIWQFKTAEAATDVKLIVEGKTIHYYRQFLVFSSPVFGIMFGPNFRESRSDSVPFPEKTLDKFLLFLEQLHPSFAWKPLAETDLESLLIMADEYNVAHIKTKCQGFIRQQMESGLSAEQVTKYLWLNEKYSLNEMYTDLIYHAGDHILPRLKDTRYLSKLQPATVQDLERETRRVDDSERVPVLNTFIRSGQLLRRLKLVMKTVPTVTPVNVTCNTCIVMEPDFSLFLRFDCLKKMCKECLTKKVAVILQTFNEKFQEIKGKARHVHFEDDLTFRI